jgi:hypothetical protein
MEVAVSPVKHENNRTGMAESLEQFSYAAVRIACVVSPVKQAENRGEVDRPRRVAKLSFDSMENISEPIPDRNL